MNYLKDLEYLKDKLKKANTTYQTKSLDNIETALYEGEVAISSLNEICSMLNTKDINEIRDLLYKTFKALEIIKKNVKVYGERFTPLGKIEIEHIYLDMEKYVSQKNDDFDLLKGILL